MTEVTLNPTPQSFRWIHLWAVLTVCATFVLLLLGAIVTSFRVGMADPVWPTSPWYLFGIDWREPSTGFLIEHSHRLAGYIVGCCIIVLAVSIWMKESRNGVKWLAALALVAVIFQGLLGGFRVKLNELMGPNLAAVHGCFAQIVLALLVALAVVTARSWQMDQGEDSPRLRHASLWTCGVIYLQIVLGAILRHNQDPLGQRGHMLTAFAVVASVVWLTMQASDSLGGVPLGVKLLAGFVVCQLILGIESWLIQYTGALPPEARRVTVADALLRTSHALLGYCLFATSVAIALRAHRHLAFSFSLAAAPARPVEGAA